ncbi:MAG: bifunctional adenosylcobinamide kinase/adenosylcobinamide-phosphate guanylyltransferase [Clostridiales bacterium]|nr:bifunctional adenosylcobinamide kinase/adenosylcobinamide-phosphate guanylyltransferase [Clostridiales bacterium]
MILVLGGIGAGKKEYVRSLGYADADFTSDPDERKPVFGGLDAYLRENPIDTDKLFHTLLKKEVVICAEVGSGVIPLERAERAYRETVGRLCVILAQEASAVVRVVAGIPVVIKGNVFTHAGLSQ